MEHHILVNAALVGKSCFIINTSFMPFHYYYYVKRARKKTLIKCSFKIVIRHFKNTQLLHLEEMSASEKLVLNTKNIRKMSPFLFSLLFFYSSCKLIDREL